METIDLDSIEIEALKGMLESEIKKSSCVFIVGHKEPDFDSIGSSIGLQAIASHFGKEAYIIVDDDPSRIEPGVKIIMESNRESSHIITKEDFKRLVRPNALLIITDTNKHYKVSVADSLDAFQSIVILDHHEKDKDTIQTPNMFIKTNLSSCSEIVTALLKLNEMNYSPEVANALLAGIALDTKRFFRTGNNTHGVAQVLKDHKASEKYVNNLFRRDFYTRKRIANLVYNEVIFKYYGDTCIAFTLNRHNPTERYFKEDLAAAADELNSFQGIDGAFTEGFVEEGRVHMSARGSEKIDVVEIVTQLQGELGGNSLSAGGSIYTEDLLGVEQSLMQAVDQYFQEDKPKEKVYKNEEKS